ncbi:MAG: hypothetical protein JSR82_13235 [Verrucomicrobia bacterium]|nr:hypothetical protein [Verrucomicrobiota bacterium]
MNVRIPGLVALLLPVWSLPCAAQPAKPTPTPKEKIVHPSAVVLPTPVRSEPEIISVNFDKIALPDAVDFLERLTGEKHAISLTRKPAEIMLSIRLQGPKLLVVSQLRQIISNQAEVKIERVGAGWAVLDRAEAEATMLPPGVPLGNAATAPAAGGVQKRPHPPLPQGAAPTPTPVGK